MNQATIRVFGWANDRRVLMRIMYACALAFIGLELLRHLVLMGVPMGVYHVTGIALSIGLAVLILVVGIDAVRHRERELWWSDHVARVMATSALVSSEVSDPVSGLAAQARSLLASLRDRAAQEEFEELTDIARRAEGVEKILGSLALALSQQGGLGVPGKTGDHRLKKDLYFCVLAYVGLEVGGHALMVVVPMNVYHLISAALSIGLAVWVSKKGIKAVRQREHEFECSDRVARVVAASTMVRVEVGDPVSGLAARARYLVSRLGGRATREEFEQLRETAHRAENVEQVLRSLAFALSGYEPPKARA